MRLEDREELGRWLSSLATSNDSHRMRRPLSNLYGSDAARTNCVRTRKRIADAVRDKLESIDWKTLPIDDAGGYEAVLGGVDNITIAEPEPDLDLDGEESDTDSEATVV